MAETASGFDFSLDTESLTPVHWGAIALALVTGVIHLYLFQVEEFLPFLLGGLGYLGAVVLLLVGFYRRILYLVGVPFVLLHIGGWVDAGMPDGGWVLGVAPDLVTLGTIDKVIEVVLLVLLVYLYWTETRTTAPQSPRAEQAS